MKSKKILIITLTAISLVTSTSQISYGKQTDIKRSISLVATTSAKKDLAKIKEVALSKLSEDEKSN